MYRLTTAKAAEFFSGIDIKGEDDCWLWMAAESPERYGSFNDGNKHQPATRVMWKILHGSIQDGHYICHHCDVPACVNPKHLFSGTPGDNMRDMVNKKRHRPLTREVKKKIIIAYESEGLSAQELSVRFDRHVITMANIIENHTKNLWYANYKKTP